jgi:uncharacterized protein YgbK (DUF1537 family)
MRLADNRVLVLADDLTGALEVGALFAGRGVEATVAIAAHPAAASWNHAAPVQVLDTETRHLAPEDAFRIVRAFAGEAGGRGFRYIYKKTDSTLRGNIGSEIAAVMAACPDAPLVYVPAYPQLGRTVVEGKLLVNGVPVTETGFSADMLNPVRESHIPTLLGTSFPDIPVYSVSVEALRGPLRSAVYLVDGMTEEDIRSAARILAASSQVRLVAGPAGLARHLAELMNLPRRKPPEMPRIVRCLVVNGSRHQAAAAQVNHAVEQDWPMLDVDDDPGCSAAHDWVLLQSPGSSSKSGLKYAAQLGQNIRTMIMRACFDGMVVFGGDTAFEILDALGVFSMRSIGEALPGVPVTKIDAAAMPSDHGPRDHDFYLVTKAGGFGSADLLTRIRRRLSGS